MSYHANSQEVEVHNPVIIHRLTADQKESMLKLNSNASLLHRYNSADHSAVESDIHSEVFEKLERMRG